MSPFYPSRYHDTDTGRYRWAVFHLQTRVWYFARRRGQAAARALAHRLNKGAA